MNQLKIVFIVLLIGMFSSGCYTVVYNNVDGDVYNQETTIIVPPPPTYYPHPAPPPVYYPPPPPPAPKEPEYKTRPPENNGGNKERDPSVIDPIRNGGERGNGVGRRWMEILLQTTIQNAEITAGEKNEKLF